MAGLLWATCCIAFATAASAAVATPASVLQASRAAIAKQPSVHVVFTAHSKTTSERIVANDGTASGSETVSEGASNVRVKVTPTFAYVSGNASGLTKLFGLSPSIAKKVGTRWVAWNAKSSEYVDLKSDVKSSVTSLLPTAAGSTLKVGTFDGRKVYLVSWVTPAADSVPRLSNVLIIAATGSALPLKRTSTAPGGTIVSTELSRWGKPIAVDPPPQKDVIQSSKVGA